MKYSRFSRFSREKINLYIERDIYTGVRRGNGDICTRLYRRYFLVGTTGKPGMFVFYTVLLLLYLFIIRTFWQLLNRFDIPGFAPPEWEQPRNARFSFSLLTSPLPRGTITSVDGVCRNAIGGKIKYHQLTILHVEGRHP